MQTVPHPCQMFITQNKEQSYKVMAAKKKAKTVKIHKDLAFGIKRMLVELVDRKQELELDSVWTMDGKVCCKFAWDGKVYTINSLDDYLNLTSYHHSKKYLNFPKCAFPQKFQHKEHGEISPFFAVHEQVLCQEGLDKTSDPINIFLSSKVKNGQIIHKRRY